MRNVLADLAIESEAATTVDDATRAGLRRRRRRDDEQAFARLATAVTKYWVCKRAPVAVAEAIECLGGSGYVEESVMPRLFRESPLNGDLGRPRQRHLPRRAARDGREPEASTRSCGRSTGGAGQEPRLDASSTRSAPSSRLRRHGARARRIVERMALALQGSLLVRHGEPAVASAFCASRLGGDWGQAFGTLPRDVDCRAIVDRAWAD